MGRCFFLPSVLTWTYSQIASGKRDKMKYYIRRAVAGLVSIPFVAGAWCFVYLAFVIAGGEPTQGIAETFSNGVAIGIIVAVMLTFAPQVSKFITRVSGE